MSWFIELAAGIDAIEWNIYVVIILLLPRFMQLDSHLHSLCPRIRVGVHATRLNRFVKNRCNI